MKLFTSTLTLLALAASVGASGCAADATSPADEDTEDSTSALGSVNVANPSGIYLASITANGTGCPAGTWDANISPDGKAFTVTFNAYEAVIDPGQAIAIKDCTLNMKFRAPDRLSFAVRSFQYEGYALLDSAGMSAKQTAKYYWQGNAVPARELRTDMKGPFDDTFLFSDNIGVADLVWSPCGVSRSLNAQSRLVLQNNRSKTGTGFANITEASTPNRWTFWLDWRRC
jgi:hypothetical protein